MREDHLHAHERQHHAQADLEVMELVHHARQREVERAQPEDGEHVRGIDDERVFRDREDRRDGVHGKDQVGHFHQQQHHEQRRGHADAVLAHEEFIPAIVRRDRHEPLEPLHHRIALGMNLLLALHDHLDAGEDQEAAEHVDDPRELGDKRRARYDHDGPHDQRAEDAPEQHLVLIQRRHGEIGEQQREHEHVVHAQRFLDEIAGEELQRLGRAGSSARCRR